MNMARSVRRSVIVAAFVSLVSTPLLCTADERSLSGNKRDRSDVHTLLEESGWKAEDFFSQRDVIKACKAMEEGDAVAFAELQRSGVNLNTRGRHGVTPLLWAMLVGNFDMYCRLLELGADPNVALEIPTATNLGKWGGRISLGDTAFALSLRLRKDTAWFIKTLHGGGDVGFVDKDTGVSILGEVVSLEFLFSPDDLQLINDVVSRGADINHQDLGGETVLIRSFRANQYVVTNHLIEQGASVDCYDDDDWQLIHFIAMADVLRLEQHARDKAFRESWEKSHLKGPWEQLVKAMSERGYSLTEAKVDFHRRKETVDGVPYMKLRRMKRNERDACGQKVVVEDVSTDAVPEEQGGRAGRIVNGKVVAE
jgi:ankyrin repeat protein